MALIIDETAEGKYAIGYCTSLPLQYYLLFQGGTGQRTEGDLGILTAVGDSGQRIPLMF